MLLSVGFCMARISNMGNENQWAGPILQRSVDNHTLAPSRSVAETWDTQWTFHGNKAINVPSLPVDMTETEVVALFSSLAVKSVLPRDDDASASFSEAHPLASDCYHVADSYAKRELSDSCIDVLCGVDLALQGESGEVCDPTVRQETGITSSGGNSCGCQSTGWGTPPDRNDSSSSFSFESYSGSEQWAATRSAVINYWPVDYEHKSVVCCVESSSVPDTEYNRELNQRACGDWSSRGGRTCSIKTVEVLTAAQKNNRGEQCQTCYERQLELAAIDNDVKNASSEFKLFGSEARTRWFPRSHTVESCGGMVDYGS
ncbi:uncharacterized protein LOC126267310 [Schistocerca gregaria]|uniref:uncharacterized protein LOC126267310 n=1 Tax=Schistocerca gregaria TaxID=7010 RepID=UPI00211E38D2|nr:uncharacterized protein LOC126267310 [Schistocerca gregaria]